MPQQERQGLAIEPIAPITQGPCQFASKIRMKSMAWTLTARSPIVASTRRGKESGSSRLRALKRHQA